jgi:Ca-activated chloride channel family protein
MRRVPIDRFQWPLALALLCLAIEPLLRERRGRATHTSAVGVAVLLAAASAHAASPRQAAQLYAAGEYDKALAEYRAAAGTNGDDPKLDFNVGAAAYKAGEFGDAAAAFERALRSDDAGLQAEGFYNLGNTQFRLGQKTVQSNPQQTMQSWQQALDAYEGALKVKPDDDDARFNRDFVKHALEELQKQQQQQKNDQKQQQPDDKKDQDKQQKSDQQQQQDQQQQGEQQPRDGEQKDQQNEQQQQPKPDQQQNEGAKPQDDQQQQAEGGDGKVEPRDQQPKDAGDKAARAAQQPVPGQMSPAEAKELLDSQDSDATLQQLEAKQAKPRMRATERDW